MDTIKKSHKLGRKQYYLLCSRKEQNLNYRRIALLNVIDFGKVILCRSAKKTEGEIGRYPFRFGKN